MPEEEKHSRKTYKKKVVQNYFSRKKATKFNTKYCNNKMSFGECQLAILNHYVEKNEAIQKKDQLKHKNIHQMTLIIEEYIRKRGLICYGGTAINNILPVEVQFYDHEVDAPDYDCYTTDAMKDAKELADLYKKAGFQNVEAKAAVHMGSIKVFVEFINMADFSLLDPILFENFKKDAIVVKGIHYAPPNVLRMNAYIETASPKGYVGRWEKVVKRMALLDHYYPLSFSKKCSIQKKDELDPVVSEIILNILVSQKVVFFGGYAASFYSKFMPDKKVEIGSMFDALCLDPKRTAEILQNALEKKGYHANINKHEPLDELIPLSYEVLINEKSVAFLYYPNSCYNYNTIPKSNVPELKKDVRIATIDTILAFYLAFYYSDRPYYDKDRIMCMAKFLFDVQKETKLLQKGILKRFNSSCLGNTKSLADMLEEKVAIMKKRHIRNKEFSLRFFHYIP